jgi:hypothetical protein
MTAYSLVLIDFGIEGFKISDLPPALAVAAGEKHAIWRRRRPALQALDQTIRIRPPGPRSNIAFPHTLRWKLQHAPSPE